MSDEKRKALRRAMSGALMATSSGDEDLGLFEELLAERGFKVVSSAGLDLALSRGCSHCGGSLLKARYLLGDANDQGAPHGA